MLNEKDLQIGDWVNCSFGFGRCDFYVLDLDEVSQMRRYGCKSWLVADAEWGLLQSRHFDNAIYLGRGKRRWWWYLLPGLNQLICPFTNPKKRKVVDKSGSHCYTVAVKPK